MSNANANPSTGNERRLSVRGKVTLARQIARELTESIRAGELGPGEPLPTEAELAESYQVNRLTVRQAVAELVAQGLVSTARGRRSSVSTPPVRYRVDETPGASLTSWMAEQGLAVGHEVAETATVDVADAPHPLDDASRCVRYRYRRWVDGSPWSESCTWLADDLVPGPWDGTRPLLDEVADRHGLQIHRAVRTFGAVPAGLDDSEQLDVAVGAPLLLVTGTSVDQHGRTIAAVRHHVRGDRAEYVVDLTR